MAILSFADSQLEELYRTGTSREHSADLIERILMALDRLDVVARLQELHFPRSLRLTKDARESNRFRIHVKDSAWISFVWQHPHCLDVRLE
ncbi:hypothetical protein JJL56_28220 [Azospirillum sp. YIM DDC1]|uniref:Type II toxin-antitoxin system RelE/ParE family toxin n=1 Tax=Azospirillum aestuarii TaxID=2802052 RepID=A0ABS1I7Q9_9PROT|nr:hypothetical protein [Azospirillum aestuarii]MBK4722747.1 hypothetical protein [Azospirillum aestuarii]